MAVNVYFAIFHQAIGLAKLPLDKSARTHDAKAISPTILLTISPKDLTMILKNTLFLPISEYFTL